MNILY